MRRMISYSRGKGKLRHTNRKFLPSNVDVNRIADNIIIKQENLKDAYNLVFGSQLKAYNDKQKREDRKIKDYFVKLFGTDNEDIKKLKDRNPNKRNRKKFSNEQIAEIMAVDNTDIAKTVLMLIYSGLRISRFLNLKKVNCHLEDRYINVVASKTDNGIRKVPIADKTIDYWRYFYDKPDSEYLVSMDGRDFSKAKGQTAYRNTYWNPFMEALGFNKRDIHETRYTCISKLEDAEIYQAKINRIVGHTGKTVAENVYTHLDIQELIEAINKI